ncbi:glycosyltransferase [Candidatus Uhrbacteria bacterium]|nr:glycosyltransferase [Candidatus Uhrbacteria bacterium]MBD3283908.1 glycosyltransferase [Candidatus Uhrbacteria bacterium]
MKDLRIIIVSWNVRGELDRCLKSLPDACRGLDWEAVVVDNASEDGSGSVVQECGVAGVRFIQNVQNRGFAKACNQGLLDLDARYVLLLNPDTICPEGSLKQLLKDADQRPASGILGPKIVNEDGSIQPSTRRFPGIWDQTGILLKLNHLIKKPFSPYLGLDVDYEKEQEVDQVMGACFLIRREVIDQIGGLDERYFVWFEEVDYCKQAQKRGWKVTYLPSATVQHVGGMSFKKVISLKRQRMFNDSRENYFGKWHPNQLWLLQLLRPIAMALTWLAHQQSKMQPLTWKVYKWIGFIVLIEALSLLTIFRDDWNAIAILTIGLLMGVFAYKRPTLALSIIALELLIGSKGALFQLWGWPGAISLRMMLFGTFFIGWFGQFVIHGNIKQLIHQLSKRLGWMLLGVAIFYGFVRGYFVGNESLISDGNAWIYILLLIPVIDLASRYPKQLKEDVVPVLLAGPIWLATKTFVLEYFFAHGFKSVATEVYLWVRRTGVGEVTLVTGNAFRIFMQSYIFALPAFLFGTSWMLSRRVSNNEYRISKCYPWMIAAFGILGISLSRSIWMGCAAGLLVLAWFYRTRLFSSWKSYLHIVGSGVIALILIVIAIQFPLPKIDYTDLGALFGSRASTGDAASVSRWNLLPAVWNKIQEQPMLGHGFGATVTYQTEDPRILAQQPDGMYTTYAFEWGWLEHWVKFGVLGFLIVIYLVYRLIRRAMQAGDASWITYGVTASLIGISVVHVFSPYLNHPLGIGALLMVEGWLTVKEYS